MGIKVEWNRPWKDGVFAPNEFQDSMEDAQDLLKTLQVTGSRRVVTWSVYFIHEAEPLPKARPRLSSGRIYTPKRTAGAEESLAWSWREATKHLEKLDGTLALVALFYRSNQRRVDGDNLLKLVMDSGTKAGVWYDDSQVTACASVMHLDTERPRTVIGLGPLGSSMIRHFA